MKSRSIPKNALSRMLICGCLAVLISQSGFAAGPGEEEPGKKSKTKNSTLYARNNNSVKIYSDPVKRIMHVVAKENEGKEVDFFVFDLEGTLMHNYRMKAKDHVRIQGLARGTYVYRVFSGDLETASGNFEIR